MSPRSFGPAPRWWPDGEPWPPPHNRRWRHGRRRFLFRIAVLLVIVLSLSAYGAVTLMRSLVSEGGQPTTTSLTWLAIALLALGFVAVMRLVGRPLGDVVGAAERVAAGDFTVRVSEHGPPSLRSVASAFNRMMKELERQQHARRALMSDIAHELRTPLSVMQGRLEGMLDGVYPRDEQQVMTVLEDTRTLARLVEDLRTLAHSESGTLALAKEPVDIGVLIAEIVEAFEPQARSREVAFKTNVAAPQPTVNLDPVRIREVLVNLLENAVRHSPRHTTIRVEVDHQARQVRIRVIDQGAGISPEALPHIFDRFYKGPGSNGSGLGLTIARNLVVAHGGTIDARPRAEGGTTVEFALPTE